MVAVAQPKLKVRRPKIAYDETPKYWIIGDPQSTHALNILNFGIPAGERFFIDSVKLAVPYITDPTLRADVKSFIGQESIHARLHEKAAAHLGLFDSPTITRPVERADKWRESLYARVDAMPEPRRKRAVLIWLSTTMIVEHVTALLADQILDEKRFDPEAVDPAMRELLFWHASEELEHRSLPFDVYQHLGGGYLGRVWPAAIVIPGFLPAIAFVTQVSMMVDRDLRRVVSLRRYVKAVRRRRVPDLFRMWAGLPAYLRPGHHPDHTGTHDEKAQTYLRENVMPIAS